MSEPQQERDVPGDQITVGPITDSIGVAIGPGAQANVTVFISSDDALGPERERLLELLSSLPLSRPLIVDSTPSSQRHPDQAAAALARSQVFVMLFNGDTNDYLESEQRWAREAGIADRLYLNKLPPDQETDPPLANLLGVPPIAFQGVDDLPAKALPGLLDVLKDRLSQVDLEALLKWAMAMATLYGLGQGVLDLLRRAIEVKAQAVSPEQPAPGEGSGTAAVPPERPAVGRAGQVPAQLREAGEAEEPPGLPAPVRPLRTGAGGLTVANAQNIRALLARPDPPRRIWWEKTGQELCLVPAGPFLMGTREDEIPALIKEFGGDASWYQRETPQHPVSLSTFYIARYPVTQAQYARFVQATGHETLSRVSDAYKWDAVRRTPPPGKNDHPVVGVRWSDVLAYCRWAGLTLPSEAEWEKAARGPHPSPSPASGGGAGRGRIYPWGDRWDAARCNTSEGKKGGTTPVGLYSPGGDSFYGCADMAGNAWEWTRSRWGKDWSKPDFVYPYDPADGREDLAAEGTRVVRGGSWDNSNWDSRCACRGRSIEDNWNGNGGFRVSVSLAFSGF